MTTAAGALGGIAHDLYGLPPAEFTAARNARAKRAKTEGDPELAAAVTSLRKPVAAAWVVNLMVRQLPDRIGDLVALGEELRAAQDDMDAATLRALTAQRRALTATVAREGAALAAELGQNVTGPVTEQVQATLHAAMTDEQAARAVRSGLLVAPLEATGLDDVDLDGVLAVPLDDVAAAPAARADGPTDLSARRASAKAKAAKEVTDAKAELAVAEAAATKTGKTMRARKEKVRTLQAQVLQLRAELDELLREVSALEEKLEPVAADLESAQDAYAEAEAIDLAAQAAVERAGKRLSKARSASR